MATTLEITPIIFLLINLENFEAIKKIIKVKNKTDTNAVSYTHMTLPTKA